MKRTSDRTKHINRGAKLLGIPRKHAAMIMRTCDQDMRAHGGFQWPREGIVTAPDWDPEPVCGSGLHGLLEGDGIGQLLDLHGIAMACVIDAREVVDLYSKVKFPRCVVAITGSFSDVTPLMTGSAVVKHTATAGNRGMATVGDVGTATAGDVGTATAGDDGTATAGTYGTATAGTYGMATAGNGGTATAGNGGMATVGDVGTATAGDVGTATAGDDGTATAGTYGMATAGNGGTATAGNGGMATAGDGGTATAGNGGTATAGNGGTATAGTYGMATAGKRGEIRIRWWDTESDRNRVTVGYVGEDGIVAGTAYRVGHGGELRKAE